jgi:hypothetical protein
VEGMERTMEIDPPTLLAGGCLAPVVASLVMGSTLFAFGAYRRTRGRWPRAGFTWLTFWLVNQVMNASGFFVVVDLLLVGFNRRSPSLREGSPLSNVLLLASFVMALVGTAGFAAWYYSVYQPARMHHRDDVLG